MCLKRRADLMRRSSPIERALMRSNASLGAFAWLAATGSNPKCAVPSPVYQVMLHMRVGLTPPVVPDGAVGCSCRARGAHDASGFHLACHFSACTPPTVLGGVRGDRLWLKLRLVGHRSWAL